MRLLLVCERYSLLPNDKKQMIAGELDRSVREIERKISVSFCSPLFFSLSEQKQSLASALTGVSQSFF